MSRIAIITARGGSKRIPKKNIKDFCGKPIIAYSIEAAMESRLFDEVMVSTDSKEIVEVARKYGANVPFMRSSKTSDDYATTADVLNEVLNEYKSRGQEFDQMACIYPTAPFITAKKLQDAIKLLDQNNVDAVYPVIAFSYPPMRCLVIRDGSLFMKWPEYERTRSQDLESLYHDCGQFYVYNVTAYLSHKALNTVPIIVSELEVQDIDNETDWKLAELKYQLMISSNL